MRHRWILLLALATLSANPFIAPGQEAGTGSMEMDEAPPLAPTWATTAIWTNKLGYTNGEQVGVYMTTNPMGDPTKYTEFIYMENIKTGERKYIAPEANSGQMHTEVVDSSGMAAGAFEAATVRRRNRERVWFGSAPTLGLWQFVAELRSEDTTQVAKRAYAKFVVTQNTPVSIGSADTDTEISTDTTWTRRKIYRIRHQVFVNSGATLTIEPGTLILASGQNAVIVVEKGAKIRAEGRLDAPIVMTCDMAVGTRTPGCWGGLIVLGNAPTTRGTDFADGVVPATRPTYGGDDGEDSSGVLRYVRVEFAGAASESGTTTNAFGFHGVGSGTVIEHIQAHASNDDGIEFFGGTASCRFCVSSGAKDDSLDWSFGWQGLAQFVFLQQNSAEGDNGIEADNDSSGFDRLPRSHPTLYNLTMVGGRAQDSAATSEDGMRIQSGTAITSRNVIVSHFGGDALDVRDNSPSLFADGTSGIQNALLHANGGQTGNAQIESGGNGVETHVKSIDRDPNLVNVRYEANPDPRPMLGSAALKIGAGAVPPSTGKLDTSAQCIGAFCENNWLEEWTFFGAESHYAAP